VSIQAGVTTISAHLVCHGGKSPQSRWLPGLYLTHRSRGVRGEGSLHLPLRSGTDLIPIYYYRCKIRPALYPFPFVNRDKSHGDK
jgi:hypothetical protein